jgi:hypothetical protein
MTHPSASRRYVAEVIELYLWLPGTPHRASRQDRRLAAALYEQAVPLLVVRAALLLATARRTLRCSHLMPLPPVRTLHYFLPVVEEVLHQPPDPGYVDYSVPSSNRSPRPRLLRPWRPSPIRKARFYASANTRREALSSRSPVVASQNGASVNRGHPANVSYRHRGGRYARLG